LELSRWQDKWAHHTRAAKRITSSNKRRTIIKRAMSVARVDICQVQWPVSAKGQKRTSKKENAWSTESKSKIIRQ
jgi:hypothetical protein